MGAVDGLAEHAQFDGKGEDVKGTLLDAAEGAEGRTFARHEDDLGGGVVGVNPLQGVQSRLRLGLDAQYRHAKAHAGHDLHRLLGTVHRVGGKAPGVEVVGEDIGKLTLPVDDQHANGLHGQEGYL